MAHIVTVTITGGAYLGPSQDKQFSINADNIIQIEDVGQDEIGNSVITMSDKSKHYVSETRQKLEKLINKK